MTDQHVAAGWHVDPDDPHLMRWWDGDQWGHHRKPRTVVAAEDHARILNEQTQLLAGIRNDIATIKAIATFWLVLTLLGIFGVIVAIAQMHG